MTLITQEQHFVGLLIKIKISFILNEHLFSSQKELILHYHNVLDFRFAQGSIAFTQNLIVNQLQQSDGSNHQITEFDSVIYKTIC